MDRIIPSSQLIINSDGTIFHLHIRPEELAGDVILVGDPGRVDSVSKFFDTITYLGSSREFRWATGLYCGCPITVLSTGIGTDNIDIVMNELDALANIDFDTRQVKKIHKKLRVVRLGTSGAVQPNIELGAYVASEYSVGIDSLAHFYKDRELFCEAALEDDFYNQMGWSKNLSRPYVVKNDGQLLELFSAIAIKGATLSAPGFYAPQGRSLRLGVACPNFIELLENFSYNGIKITNIEMEGSAIAFFAKALGHQAITVCLIVTQRHSESANVNYKTDMEQLIQKTLDLLSKKS